MRSLLSIAAVIALVGCIVSATLLFGAVTPDYWAVPAFGAAAVLALVWLVKLVFVQPCHWKKSPLHWPVAGFLVYTLARYWTSPIEYEARFELLQVALYGTVYFAAASSFHRRRDRMILLGALGGLAVLQSAYGFWQFAQGQDAVLHLVRPAQYHGRGSGTYVCPNHLSGFLEMVLGLLLARTALRKDRTASAETRVLGTALKVFAILVVLVGILITYSRGGWIATGLGLLIFAVWGSWKMETAWPRVALAASMIVALGVIGFKVLPQRLLVDRSLNRQPATAEARLDTTFGDRVPLWEASVRIVSDYPLFGTGPGTWRWYQGQYRTPRMQENPDYAHSDVLNLTADYGLVGLALVIAAFACFYRHALVLARSGRTSDERSFAVGSVLSVTMILCHSLYDFNLHITSNALLLVTLLGFTAAMEDKDGRYPFVPLTWVPRIALAVALAGAWVAVGWVFPRTAAAYQEYWKGMDARKEALDWDAALQHYQRSIELDPKFPDAYVAAGRVHLDRGRMKRAVPDERREHLRQAVTLFEQALKLNPRQTLTWLHLAEAYELADDGTNALNTYQRAITVDPKSAFVFVRLGKFHERAGDEAHATEAYQHANRLHGDPIAEGYLFDRGLPLK